MEPQEDGQSIGISGVSQRLGQADHLLDLVEPNSTVLGRTYRTDSSGEKPPTG